MLHIKKQIRIVHRSLADLIYDLVVNHVRDQYECLDGRVSSEIGVIQVAVSVHNDGKDGIVAFLYQDSFADDDDAQLIEHIKEAQLEDEDDEEEDD